jgi:hypothetical protein
MWDLWWTKCFPFRNILVSLLQEAELAPIQSKIEANGSGHVGFMVDQVFSISLTF